MYFRTGKRTAGLIWCRPLPFQATYIFMQSAGDTKIKEVWGCRALNNICASLALEKKQTLIFREKNQDHSLTPPKNKVAEIGVLEIPTTLLSGREICR